MKFEKLFKSLSYAAVFCGFFAIWASGTFGIVGTVLFMGTMAAAWFLEGSRWQISERLGTVLIVAALPLFYALWKIGFFQFGDTGAMAAGILGRLILSLTAIKMLQRKSDRDWIFLYLMSFFEVLLAAGLSISALYLFSFVLYVFVIVCTIIVFEIRKTERATRSKMDAPDEPAEPAVFRSRWLPVTAAGLIAVIIVLAVPIFFALPRVGGAGLGGSQSGVSTSTGFSDTVKLGGIGNIQQNNEIVMRVRLDGANADANGLRWRGLALDTFDNKSWSRSQANSKEPRQPDERDIIQIDYTSGREGLTVQTVYLEPLDKPILFALPRLIGVQGNFPVLFKDKHDSVSFNRVGERISYKVLSDRAEPDASLLRADRAAYSDSADSYLALPPDLDPRIAQLAAQAVGNERSRYDKARAIEAYLQNSFGYTLEMKASGDQPLADFLFNVREGHCEYFATAMAVMLRTQGIATRIVNGFSEGEYNETADVWVVRQRNAHSWVEVYFPGQHAWVTFDPTPFSGQTAGVSAAGIAAQFNKYLEAVETFWIQYFVAYDNQEQRSLFTSVKRGFADYQAKTTNWMQQAGDRISEWWSDVRGDKGIETSAAALGRGLLYLAAAMIAVLLFVWACRRVVRLKVWARLRDRVFGRRNASIVEFYERLIRLLESRGFVRQVHQTPMEFAYAVGVPEAVRVTEKYNRVRFGNIGLSDAEIDEIESELEKLASEPPASAGGQ